MKNKEATKKLDILLVEDDSFYQSLFVTVLPNHNVIKAANGNEALEKFENCFPDIVFLDINLPDMSGIEVLKKILEKNSAAYVVMISGNNQKGRVTEAVDSGATGYITKPYSRASIDIYIDKYARNL